EQKYECCNRGDEHRIAPDEIPILAQINLALRWLSIDLGGNPIAHVHRMDPLSRVMPKLPVWPSAHRIASLQKTPLVFFQNKTGQAAGCIGSRVNADSIKTNLRSVRRRVTMHDKFSVFRLTGQELASDIQKVIASLAIEGHAWPYSSMTEEVVTDGCRNLE